MNSIHRRTCGHKALTDHASASSTFWGTISCVLLATPRALTVEIAFGEPSTAVGRCTVKRLSDVHVVEIAKPFPSATVGALGKQVTVSQTYVRVQHHLWVQISLVLIGVFPDP
jgi:hypothetical protein